MKSTEINNEFDLEGEQKRCRGRPPAPTKLTAAERAKRYRDKKRANKRDASQNFTQSDTPERIILREAPPAETTSSSFGKLEAKIILLNATNFGLTEDLHDAQEYILKLRDALQVFINAKIAKKPVPAKAFADVRALLKR